MRMASLLLSVPDLIQAVIPVAAWWRKYFRKALASADSGLAAGLAAAGLAVTSWTTAAGRAAGAAGWEVNAVVAAAVPSTAAATAVVSTNRFTPALAWILRFLCCMTAPGCCPVPDDLRLRARGCGTGTQTVAGRWQHKTASCRGVAADCAGAAAGVPRPCGIRTRTRTPGTASTTDRHPDSGQHDPTCWHGRHPYDLGCQMSVPNRCRAEPRPRGRSGSCLGGHLHTRRGRSSCLRSAGTSGQ